MLDFFDRHLVLAALFVSGLWFYAGHQFVAKGTKGAALAWEIIALLLLLIFCINAIIAGLWLSLVVALCFGALEVWLMVRDIGTTKSPNGSYLK